MINNDFRVDDPRVVQTADPEECRRPIPTKLYDLGQVEVVWEPAIRTQWAYLTPKDKPNCNEEILRDVQSWLKESKTYYERAGEEIRYMVMGSRFPGVFNLGGDLAMFADAIERGDRDLLQNYGSLCVDIVHTLWCSNSMPVIMIGLVQGDAMGGGFEAMLALDVVVAERQAKFGLPEIMFGFYPGMGAYSLLYRRLGFQSAEQMMLSGRIFSAQELFDLGLVHVLVEEGQGEQAVREYIKKNNSRHAGHLGIYHAGRAAAPLEIKELTAIVQNWVETAFQLSPKDLRMMRRLAAAQLRLYRRPAFL